MEAEVASIFGEVLKLERVGAEDDFFALGGDSLAAVQALSRLRERLGAMLPIRALFDHRTVRSLAGAIDARPPSSGRPWRIPALERPAAGTFSAALSFAQQWIWIADRYSLAPALHNAPAALRLRGAADPEALRAALGAASIRHESLRTTFRFAGPSLVQEVAPERELLLPLVDLSSLPGGTADREAGRIEGEEARRPFDLALGPLSRFLLLRLAADRSTLLALHHRIVFDAASAGPLLRDLARFYPVALREGRVAARPLPVQVADFAAWQRHWFEGERLEEERQRWRARLAVPPVLELPADRARPAVRRRRGSALSSRLAPDLADGVAAAGAAANATLFAALLGLYATLLRRHSGSADLILGVAVAHRNHREIEGLAGPFTNLLPLRLDLAGTPSFQDLVERAREAVLEAVGHQELAVHLSAEDLGLPPAEGAAGSSGWFSAALEAAPAAPRAVPLGPGLAGDWYELATGTAPVDLHLRLAPEPEGGLALEWTYDRDLFDEATVGRWSRRFEVLVRSALASPERGADHLDLLAAEERRQLLIEANATARAGRGGRTVPELFAARAALHRGRKAVGFGATSWSYGELDERSNRLARRLLALGVGPESRVGVCVERSAELVAVLLAVQKAGGAYVPLDPSHPAERLGQVIEDGDIAVLVTEKELAAHLPLGAGAPPLLRLDADREAIDAESPGPLPLLAAPGSLAYVLYTSGSTGRPKGVELPQRALANFLLAMAERPGLGAEDVVPALTTISFDIAGLEIYLPLMVGARVEVLTREEASDGPKLAARLREIGATLVQATPASWRMLLDSGWQGRPGLRVLCGGEALPADLAEALLARGVELWNVYGPTETAVWSTAGRVAGVEPGAVPLGEPIANTRLYVVDPRGEPVPPGVAGELWICGLGVARGYRGRPELTAERFVPDPWPDEPGARAYRTGDLVRHRRKGGAAGEDGRFELEYLGRLDHQVKLRGFRIELGEIEAALSRLPAPHGVEAAAVVAAGRDADRFLAAYLVARAPEPPGPASFRAALRDLLPDYMVPTAWALLPALPLTPNGKVDRKELIRRAEEGASRRASPASGGEPRNPVEERLARHFGEALGRPPVGVRDDFFLLGGHSLLALRMLHLLQGSLGVELPLQAVFEAPTVEALARRIESAAAGRESEAGLVLHPRPLDGAPPLTYSQEQLLFLDRLLPGRAAYTLPLAIELLGPLDLAALRRALRGLAERHATLRTVYPGDGPSAPRERAGERGARQEILPPGEVPLPGVDLAALASRTVDAEAERLTRLELARPFDLAAGPLFRALLFRLEPERHRLVLALHHIAGDGWSLEVLARDLLRLYAREAGEREIPALPPLPLQFADYAVALRGWMSGPRLERQTEAARLRLAGAPLTLDLPADFVRPAQRTGSGGVEWIGLDPGLAEGLETLRVGTASTPYMLLLAVFEALLARWTGQDDFLLGTPYASRDRVETEDLVGFFVNTLVLRGDVTGDPSFSELAARARGQALSTLGAGDLPFERVVEALGPDRDFAVSPLFQALFAWERPVVLRDVPAAGLLVSAGEPVTPTSQFDLALSVVEEPGGLRIAVRYAADLFAATSARRLARSFRSVLRSALTDPATPVSALALLEAGERHQLLAEWQGGPSTPEAPDWPGTVEEQFRVLARRQPEAPAAFLEEASWTYGDLDRRAEAIASDLAARGVGPGDVVAVLLDRSFDLLATLLGVLRTGAAFLPIDPAMRKYNTQKAGEPAADNRFVFMMTSAGARFAVVAKPYIAALPDGDWLWLPAEELAPGGGGAGREPAFREWPARAPESLAYVMFTSGSTGLPKGIGIPHSAQVRHVRALIETLRLGAGDRSLQYASMGFDVNGEEIWPALASGGAVVLIPDPQGLPARELSRLVERQGLTLLNLPSPYWHDWIDHLRRTGEGLPAGLRQVIVGSDSVSLRRLADWERLAAGGAHGAGVELRHAYGLTETTVTSTLHLCQPFARARRGLPIGRPIPGVRAYVVDRRGEPLPAGVPGELWLGGGLLAIGCLGQPEVTADLFGPDPFAPADEPGARVCRTGDLVRRLPGGDLEFLGRIEAQVRQRGFRVEPGDVETALERLPEVASALVMDVAVEETRRLQAFVVPARPGPEGPEAEAALKVALLDALRRSLPGFMLPAGLHLLERLPTSENGKLDRKRLASLAAEGAAAERVFVPPETLVEREMAALWADVLHIEWVGADESFWELGGHSLLATRVLARVADAFGVELPLQALFQQPVLRDFARRVEGELLLDEADLD